MIALTLESIVKNPLLTNDEKNRAGLTTDFYLHGQAGIFNVVENLYPTYWYGQFHPFEFEFVVNDKIGQQKLFNNLGIYTVNDLINYFPRDYEDRTKKKQILQKTLRQ